MKRFSSLASVALILGISSWLCMSCATAKRGTTDPCSWIDTNGNIFQEAVDRIPSLMRHLRPGMSAEEVVERLGVCRSELEAARITGGVWPAHPGVSLDPISCIIMLKSTNGLFVVLALEYHEAGARSEVYYVEFRRNDWPYHLYRDLSSGPMEGGGRDSKPDELVGRKNVLILDSDKQSWR